MTAGNRTGNSSEWWLTPSLRDIFIIAGGLGIFNIVCILLTNTVLIVTISTTKKLRSVLINQLIISVAVCNWILGAVWCPMKIDYIFLEKWRFGCWMHVGFQMYEGYIQIFVTTWVLVIYNTCYIMEVTKTQTPTVSHNSLMAFRLGILAAPWLLGIAIIVPVTMATLRPVWNQGAWNEAFCPLLLTDWAHVLLPCFCFFFPATILLLQTLYILINLNARRRGSKSLSLVSRRLSRKVSISVMAASLLTVFLTLGEEIHYVAVGWMKWDTRTRAVFWLATQFLADFQKVALPLVWIFLHEIKEEIRMKIKWRLRGRYMPDDSIEITYYRNYSEH